MKLIVRETNYTQIVMSREFETLEQPLMVEIIRRKQLPQIKKSQENQLLPHHSNLSLNHQPTMSHQQFSTHQHQHESHGKKLHGNFVKA
jgi:hypothetical protein